MDKINLSAENRILSGRKVKTLRKQGIIPANIFGKKVTSLSISVNLKEFSKVYEKAGETSLITLILGSDKTKKEERAVLITNVQYDAVSDMPIHVDFHQVDLKEKVTADVEVELIGESPAEKTGIGTVVQYIDEIEVEALPMDLPEKFIIDVSTLTEVDQAVFVKDLKVEKDKVEVKVDAEEIVVKIEPPQKEEVVEPTPVEGEVVEGTVPAEGEAAEGQQPAEGEKEGGDKKQDGGEKPQGDSKSK
jgi:large subunit ribosomal protein L25